MPKTGNSKIKITYAVVFEQEIDPPREGFDGKDNEKILSYVDVIHSKDVSHEHPRILLKVESN